MNIARAQALVLLCSRDRLLQPGPPPMCAAEGDACTADADCCSGQCWGAPVRLRAPT